MEDSTQAVNNSTQDKKRSRSRQKNVKLDFDSLMEKLEARLKGVKHVDKSFDWIIQHLRQSKSQSCFCQGFDDEITGLKECRKIFREQILLLKDEVDLYHRRCEDQMALEKKEVIRVKKKCERSVEKIRTQSKETKKAVVENKLSELEAEKRYLDRNQNILDGEEDLLNREEALAKGRKQLEELEKEMTLEKKEAIRVKRKRVRSVEKKRAQNEETQKAVVENKLSELEAEKRYLDRNQNILDGEEDLLNREEALAKGRKQLEELEKELEDAEVLLQKRQMMCDRKHEDLINLHEELKELRLELDGPHSASSDRAQRNWEILRRDLQDRHKLLESNIQKYRTELASASATITGKDIHINKLQDQINEFHRIFEDKDQKMRNLESRLAMALTESVRTDQTYFNQWRQQKGTALRADSVVDEVSNFSSADDSLPNSPIRFVSRPQLQRNSLKRNSLKRNGFGLANGSPEKHQTSGGFKHTNTTIHHNLHLNNEGEETPPLKSNSSSACTLM